MRTSLASACLVALLGVAGSARAQDNSAAVEALFGEGKKLEAEGNFAAACPKFLAAYNLEHRTGTLLNLAACYEKVGLFASAWARFTEARSMALRSRQTERADFAAAHAEALEHKLAKLNIVVPSGIAGIQVVRDGVPVDAAVFGVPVPVDPGEHTVEASAPGKQPWHTSAQVGTDATIVSVVVPTLIDAPKAPVEPSPAPAVVAPVVATPAPAPGGSEGKRPSWQSVVGMSLAGAGLVGTGIGAVFGFVAMSKKSQSDPYCNVGGSANDCYPPGIGLRQNAVSAGNLSSALLGVGGAMLVGGVVLWVAAPSRAPGGPRVAVSVTGRSLALGGSF